MRLWRPVLPPQLRPSMSFASAGVRCAAGFAAAAVAAFPVASLVCYVSFLLEIRTDAYKLLYNTQRPRYAGAQDIGSWQHVLTFIAVVGVFTNIGIIGYTSSALSSALPLSFFGLFEVGFPNEVLRFFHQ